MEITVETGSISKVEWGVDQQRVIAVNIIP